MTGARLVPRRPWTLEMSRRRPWIHLARVEFCLLKDEQGRRVRQPDGGNDSEPRPLCRLPPAPGDAPKQARSAIISTLFPHGTAGEDNHGDGDMLSAPEHPLGSRTGEPCCHALLSLPTYLLEQKINMTREDKHIQASNHNVKANTDGLASRQLATAMVALLLADYAHSRIPGYLPP